MSVSQADMQKLSLTFALASDMLRDAVTEGLKSSLGLTQLSTNKVRFGRESTFNCVSPMSIITKGRRFD